MQKRWPPPELTDHVAGEGAARIFRRPEERAQLLARYWDDRIPEDLNLDIIGWWLDRCADRRDGY